MQTWRTLNPVGTCHNPASQDNYYYLEKTGRPSEQRLSITNFLCVVSGARNVEYNSFFLFPNCNRLKKIMLYYRLHGLAVVV